MTEQPAAGDDLTEIVCERLGHVRARITAAGGDPDRVLIVAVTKGFGPEAPIAAARAGLADIGENYAQELVAKHDVVAGHPAAERLRWHFIGPVQRNKVKVLAPIVSLWEAVDRRAVGDAIATHAPGAAVLVEVNASGEATKAGCRLDETPELVSDLRRAGLDVQGLMTIGPAGPADRARETFAAVASVASKLGLTELSMGMSGDLEVAVQEGATIVRIGTALFGPRPSRSDLRR